MAKVAAGVSVKACRYEDLVTLGGDPECQFLLQIDRRSTATQGGKKHLRRGCGMALVVLG